MAAHNSVQAALRLAGTLVDGRIAGGRITRHRYDVVLAGQAVGDTINLGPKPRGFLFADGALNSDVSLGTSTIAVGTAASPEKYRAAAVHQTPDTPVRFGKTAAAQEAEPAGEDLILTIGVAALPGAGNLAVEVFCSDHG